MDLIFASRRMPRYVFNSNPAARYWSAAASPPSYRPLACLASVHAASDAAAADHGYARAALTTFKDKRNH